MLKSSRMRVAAQVMSIVEESAIDVDKDVYAMIPREFMREALNNPLHVEGILFKVAEVDLLSLLIRAFEREFPERFSSYHLPEDPLQTMEFVFPLEELRLMEIAFYGRDVTTLFEESFLNAFGAIEGKKCYTAFVDNVVMHFYTTYPSPFTRIKAIMLNVLRNGGMFEPESEVAPCVAKDLNKQALPSSLLSVEMNLGQQARQTMRWVS
jgi:hypothetical protein